MMNGRETAGEGPGDLILNTFIKISHIIQPYLLALLHQSRF